MSRSRVFLLLLSLACVGLLIWLFLPPQPAVHRQPTRVPAPAPVRAPPALAPADPAPHPLAVLPQPELLSLPMADGNPLRARWYASAQEPAPIIVLDAGAGEDARPWVSVIQALLAQRPAHVLWLDDVQPRHPEASSRRLRAVARWSLALAWLAQRTPHGRLALVGARDAADAIWRVADLARPLSFAVIAPDGAPDGALSADIAARFALVALPLAPDATPTWLAELHNARVLHLPAAHALEDEQVRADLAGWLFVALGPR